MTERARYLDIGKGIVIILMLLAHTLSGEGFIRTYISSFHMQFFFIVCGVLTASKYQFVSIRKAAASKHIKKRIFQLGVPYLFFCVLLTFFYSGVNLIARQDLHISSYISRIIFLQGIDSLWFLPVYFIAETMALLVLCLPRGHNLAVGLSGVIVLVLFVLQGRMPEDQIIRLLIKSMIGFVFICFGYELERKKLLNKISLVIAFLMLICSAVLSHINGFAAVGSLELKNVFLFFLNAVLTCTAILVLCLKTKNNGRLFDGIALIGRNTMVVLCTNNLLIESIRLLDYKITGDFLLRAGLTGSLIFTIILVILELPLIRIAEGPLAFAFGRQLKKG